jgi:transcriptional regulator with PAS, ATPase and Fis domain
MPKVTKSVPATSIPQIWMPPLQDRDQFISNLSQQLLIEMVRKEGKSLADFADNAHKTATKLADLLKF